MFRPHFNFRHFLGILAIVFFLANFSLFFTNSVYAVTGINRTVNFQGKLVKNSDGTNVANTSYSVVFALYNHPTNGTTTTGYLWKETQTVTTVDGIFRVALGSQTAFPANFNFNWDGLYLGVTVGGDSEMTPRVQMAAVPFAFNSQQVAGLTVQDSAGNASTSGILQVANAKTVKFSDAFTTANAMTFGSGTTGTIILGSNTDALSLLTGGATVATLPSGTITLVDTTSTQTLTGKIIGSGGLTFTGANTDITTNTNEDFIIAPNGTGRVGIFSPSGVAPLASFDLRGNSGTVAIASISGRTSFAGLMVDNSGWGDLFTASASGATRFVITNAGFVGVGTATPGAALDVLGAATIGGQLTFKSTFGQIQTTADQNLTIGGNTTGKITFSSFGGPTLNIGNTGGLVFAGYTGGGSGCTLKTDSNGNVQCQSDLTAAGVPSPYIEFGAGSGYVTALNSTEDFLFGSQASTSATFHLFGSTALAGTQAVASVSARTSFAGLVVDQTGLGDIFTASSSGLPLFTVTKLGFLNLAGNAASINFTGNGINSITTAANQSFAINPAGQGLVGINTDGITPLANFDVRANLGTVAIASFSGQTSYAGLTVDNSGTGDLITASVSGATKFVVKQNGSVGIGTATPGFKLDVVGSARISANSSNNDDIVKDTTSDFTQGTPCSGTGYCATNVNTAGNDMTMMVNNNANLAAAPSSGPTVLVNSISSASAIMRRQNGRVSVLGGVNVNSDRIYTYDPVTNAFLVGPNLIAPISSSGSAVFQRQDGKFVIVYGNRTDIYDPAGANYFGSIAIGPGLPLSGTNQLIAGAGSRVIQRSDGKFLILLGGSQWTVLYDPTASVIGTIAVGPTLSGTGVVASGSAVFQRPDGKYVVVQGGNTTSTNLYDPVTNTFAAGPSGITGNVGPGGNVLQLPDGRFLLINGNNTKTTNVYNFATNAFTQGPDLTDQAGTGSHAFQRPDNKWVIVIGNGSKTTDLYDPTSGANGSIAISNLLTNPVGVGGGAFQMDDGRYVVLSGQFATTSTFYDVGWKTTGTWISEDISSSKISTYSAIFWDANPQVAATPSASVQVFVKTSGIGPLSNAPYIPIQNSGDLIQTAGMASQLKIQIQFNSPVTPPYNQVVGTATPSNMWASEGSTEYMRQITTPSLYDLKVQNPMAGYGGVLASDSTEARNAATQSATFDGVVTGVNDAITLATSKNYPTSVANAGVIIASASADLGALASSGANTLQLPNGKFLVIPSNGLKGTRIYDSSTGLFTAGPDLTATTTTGTFSIPLPDGRFMVFMGGANTTNIYDPVRNVFYAGPTLSTTGTVGLGANALTRSDGRFVIIKGSTNITDIYDPFLNSFIPGPLLTGNVGAGTLSVRRSDGKYITFLGGGTVSNIYEESSNSFVVGPATVTIAAGSMAIQMANGNFVIVRGGSAVTYYIYDTRMNTFTASTATVTSAAGSFAIPLSDGKILVGNANATFATTIIDPVDPANAAGSWAGPTLPSPNAPAAGAHVFQRPDGKFVVIMGNGQANTLIIDAGWNTQGTYITEPINNINISAATSLNWKNSGAGTLSVQSRTGSSLMAMTSAAWNDVEKSSGLINPANGDTFAQFKFIFSGTIPNNLYEKERIWGSSDSGGVTQYYRSVQAPVLQYWRMLNTADPNILTLTSENINAFRFAADGQAYTAAGGAWNSGGADLAERYTSSQDLQAGEVVVGDQFDAQNVIRSTSQYQSNIMGVVSTQPGFVAGAYTPDSYPIALVGRVPLKISTENGPVHSGDYLTSASIPGYAMKATVAGRVLGTALQDFDPTDLTQVQDCPKVAAGSLSTTQCGIITAFINLTNYNGQNVELAMADQNFVASTSSGFSHIFGDTGLQDSYMHQISVGDQNILAYLESLRDAGSAAFESSEVFTGKVVAGEVISPNIIADLITAKTIRADHIEGLEILTNQISDLRSKISDLPSGTGSAVLGEATSSTALPDTLTLTSLNVDGLATVSGDLNVKGSGFIKGALNVLDSITTNNLLVSQFAYFINDVVFKGNVRFNNTPTFNSDTAGFAVIKQGEDTVQITFDQEYGNTPVVTASIALGKAEGNVSQKQLEDAILNGNISYVITARTTKGFTIRLNKLAMEDINFSWVALSVQNAKTSGLTLPTPTPDPSATQSAAFQSILNQITSPTPTSGQ